MVTYRKRPVEIQAFEAGSEIIPDWFTKAIEDHRVFLYDLGPGNGPYCEIYTLEGTMYSNYGDFIIQGIQGELYSCKRDIFFATYEAV